MFKAEATIESIATRVDNTIKIVLGTQELPPDMAVALFSMKGSLGWFAFNVAPLNDSQIPAEAILEFKTDKTPSQRLRAALFVFWQKNTNQSKPFNVFYDEWINKKVEEIKEYLP